MRFVALALILASLPIFIAFLKQQPRRRGWAMALMIFMLFLGTGALRVNASIIGWPLWAGVARGIEVTPIDTMALALLFTRDRRVGRLPMLGLLGFYGITILLSLLQSAVPMATLFSVWQYMRVLLIFVVVAGEIGREDMRLGLYSGLSLGLLLEAGFVGWEKASGVVQAGGTIGHQNTLGMMVELAVLPLLAALMTGDRRWLTRIGVVAALAVIAGGGSRGTMGIGGAGIVIFLLLSVMLRPTALKWKIVGLAALALGIAVPLALTTLNQRFAGRSYVTQEDERAAFKRAARAISEDYPLGVGANMYVSTANVQGYAQRAGVAWNQANRAAPVHDAYLLARAETGWLGEFALIVLLAGVFGRGALLSMKRRRQIGGDLVLGSTVAIGINSIHNTFEFAVHSYPVQALLVVNIALIASQIMAERQPRRVPARSMARPSEKRGSYEHVPIGTVLGERVNKG